MRALLKPLPTRTRHATSFGELLRKYTTLTIFGPGTNAPQSIITNPHHTVIKESYPDKMEDKEYDLLVVAAHGTIKNDEFSLLLPKSSDGLKTIEKIAELKRRTKAKRIFIFSCNAGGLIPNLKPEVLSKLGLINTQIVTFSAAGESIRAQNAVAMIEEVIKPENKNLSSQEIIKALFLEFPTVIESVKIKQDNQELFLQYEKIDLHKYPEIWKRIHDKGLALNTLERRRLIYLESEISKRKLDDSEKIELHKLSMIQSLAESYGRDISIVHTSFPHMAFMDAVQKQDYDLVQRWWSTGLVNINYQDHTGRTPFIQAVMSKNFKMVELLLDKGADPRIANLDGHGLAYYLITTGNQGTVDFFIQKKLISGVDETGKRLLLDIANIERRPDLIVFLIDKKVGLNDQNSDGDTALIYFCRQSKVDYIKRLLDKNVDINIVNNIGESALTLIAENGNYEITKQLLSRGADPTLKIKGENIIDVTQNSNIKDLLKPIFDLQSNIDSIPELRGKIMVTAHADSEDSPLKPRLCSKDSKQTLFSILSFAILQNSSLRNIPLLNELFNEATKDPQNSQQFKSNKSFEEIGNLLSPSKATHITATPQKMRGENRII